MNLEKLDKFWVGLLTGILFPAFCFSMYWLFFQRKVEIAENDIRYLINKELMINVFKMCGMGNLILFYVGLNKKLNSFTKGVIGSVVIYALLIAYLTFF